MKNNDARKLWRQKFCFSFCEFFGALTKEKTFKNL